MARRFGWLKKAAGQESCNQGMTLVVPIKPVK
jgi:hypothetical protein